MLWFVYIEQDIFWFRYDETTITEWYKGFRQDCPDGKLNKDIFKRIYSKCFPAGKWRGDITCPSMCWKLISSLVIVLLGNAEDFCSHVFRTFDSDNNGFIDFKEFLLAIDVTSAGSPEQKLNWAFRYGVNCCCHWYKVSKYISLCFRMYDVDGNGTIEPEEMSRIVHSIYAMMGPDQVRTKM